MKISAINGSFGGRLHSAAKNQQSFKGILKINDESNDSYNYHGMPSSYNGDGNYSGYESSYSYVYYPFKGESKEKTDKVLKENNYDVWSDGGGIMDHSVCETILGKTLPFTEKEWKSYSPKHKEQIKELL